MQAYYVIMRLPGQQKEEFLLMLPFVPNGRSNMVSWLGARSDAPNYGKAVSIVFSKSSNIYGPSQVEAAINQDPKVSSQLTLWNQSGSAAIMDNLLWCRSPKHCCTCSRSTCRRSRQSCRSSRK
jgi:uncharacterized protein